MSSSDISQIIDALVAAIERLETSTEPNARDVKDCEAAIQKMFEAANANDVDKDEKTQKVLFEIIEKGVLKSILYHMPEFNPRTRQSIKHIWLISLKSEKLKNTIDDYIRENPEILILLIRGYTKEEMIQTYGDILRFCIKHSSMLYLILFSPLVDKASNQLLVYLVMICSHLDTDKVCCLGMAIFPVCDSGRLRKELRCFQNFQDDAD